MFLRGPLISTPHIAGNASHAGSQVTCPNFHSSLELRTHCQNRSRFKKNRLHGKQSGEVKTTAGVSFSVAVLLREHFSVS